MVAQTDRLRACDLFSVFSRTADEAAEEVFAGGLTLAMNFDPSLRDSRLADPAAVARAAKAAFRAMLPLTQRGAISLGARVGPDVEQVTMTVSSSVGGRIRPDAGLFVAAAKWARDLGGRLTADRQGEGLTLSLIFPAAPSPLAAMDLVEAAELEAVEAGEHAEEDEDGQDRDHGRLVSAKVRTA